MAKTAKATAKKAAPKKPGTALVPVVEGKLDPRLTGIASEIRALEKQTRENVIKIGKMLIEAKKIAGHGGWLPWLQHSFAWSERTAQNYMKIAAE